MKIYVGNVTIDTSLKLTKQEAEKLGSYLMAYKDIKMEIIDCFVRLDEDFTLDLCNDNFNLFSFVKNLYFLSGTLPNLIKKYQSIKELMDVDFYSLEKYKKQMEDLIFSVSPKDPLSFSSDQKCKCVKTSTGTLFVNKEHPIGVVRYYYKGLRLYVPENTPGNYSCFVKEIGEALETYGFGLGIDGDRIYYYPNNTNESVVVYFMPHNQLIPLYYVFPFLMKLVNDLYYREKFVQLANKILEADTKRGKIVSSFIDTRRKIEELFYKSAGG